MMFAAIMGLMTAVLIRIFFCLSLHLSLLRFPFSYSFSLQLPLFLLSYIILDIIPSRKIVVFAVMGLVIVSRRFPPASVTRHHAIFCEGVKVTDISCNHLNQTCTIAVLLFFFAYQCDQLQSSTELLCKPTSSSSSVKTLT